jgi:hypothetical protein
VWTDRSGEVARGGAAYYVAAVLALACSQLALSGATYGDLRAGGTTALLVGGTLAVTAAAVTVFWLVFSLVGPAVGPPIGGAVETVATAVLTPPAWLLEQFFRLILGGAEPFRLDFPNFVNEVGDRARSGPQDDESTAEQAGAFFVRGLALVLGAAILIFVIAWFSRFRKRVRDERDAAAASGSAGSLRDDLAAVLKSLLPHRSRAPEDPAVSPARALYRAVLRAADRAGQPRALSETPEEFAPRAREAFHTPLTDEITQAYEQARYGGREPDPVLVAELQRRWGERA